MTEEIEEIVDVTAAAYLWTILTAIEFDDDEPTLELHEKALAWCREQWPWLDEKSAEVVARIEKTQEETDGS